MSSLVVVSHSDPNSLTHHVARTTRDALSAAGQSVEVADLAAENFDPRFTRADIELFRGTGVLADDIASEQARVDRADHLILVFPMYWWSMPALLKGWIDRVFINGWAYDDGPAGFVKKLDRLTVHLIAIAADDADSFRRHGVYESYRTQIERGIVEYVGATLGSSTFLHESESKDRATLESEVREIADAIASKAANVETIDA